MQNDDQNHLQSNEQQQNQQQGYIQPTYDSNTHGAYQQHDYGYGWDQVNII